MTEIKKFGGNFVEYLIFDGQFHNRVVNAKDDDEHFRYYQWISYGVANKVMFWIKPLDWSQRISSYHEAIGGDIWIHWDYSDTIQQKYSRIVYDQGCKDVLCICTIKYQNAFESFDRIFYFGLCRQY